MQEIPETTCVAHPTLVVGTSFSKSIVVPIDFIDIDIFLLWGIPTWCKSVVRDENQFVDIYEPYKGKQD
jgi:hypothetical protein